MTNFIPLAIVLPWLMLLLRANTSRPLLQIYLVIVVSYLNIFPAIDQIFAIEPIAGFIQAQFIAILFFEMPLFLTLAPRKIANNEKNKIIAPTQNLRGDVAILLLLLLIVFWVIALKYEQFFVRLSYEAFLENPNSIPGFFLYPYRLIVESSYFIILFLSFSLHLSDPRSPYRVLYRIALLMYLLSFLVFFFVNSRMQFLLLLLCLYFIRPGFVAPKIKLAKLLAIASCGFIIIVSLTMVREFYIESNNRLDAGDLGNLFSVLASMISGRLNSLVMLGRAIEIGYNPFGFQISGLLHLWNMYTSFVTDPETYAQIRASEITSPSVEIVNRLLSESYVDFPKSMILDIQLIFGSLSLPVLAWILASCIKFAQRTISDARHISISLLCALFITPLLLQFEKETLGFISFLAKWSPILLFLVIFQVRIKRGRALDARSALSITPHNPTSSKGKHSHV